MISIWHINLDIKHLNLWVLDIISLKQKLQSIISLNIYKTKNSILFISYRYHDAWYPNKYVDVWYSNRYVELKSCF